MHQILSVALTSASDTLHLWDQVSLRAPHSTWLAGSYFTHDVSE